MHALRATFASLRWMIVVAALPSLAQTPTGNAANGLALYNDTGNYNCKGCHGASIDTNYTQVRNAANAGGQVLYAISKGMSNNMLTATQANDVAAYIGNGLADPAPANLQIGFNGAGRTFTLPYIALNTSYGGFTGIEVVSGPSKGMVSFSGEQATYVPNNNATGADSFTWRAVRLSPPATSAGTSSVRTVTLLIDPPPVPAITSPIAASGTYGAAFTYTVTATNSPTQFAATGLPMGLNLNTSTGQISGTPAQAGTFSVSLSASNVNGSGPATALTLTVAKAAQSVTFAPQATPRAFALNGTFAINPLATATSGLPITYSSNTPSVCTANGSTVTMLAPGSCGLRATQPGNTNYLAAQADQSVFLSSGAPVLVTPTLRDGSLGTAYGAKLFVGGTPVPSSASVGGLPNGITAIHNGSGTITLSGTPTQAGLFALTLVVSNGGGQLNTTVNLFIEDTNQYANNVSNVAVGGHSCALLAGGVKCWGRNTYGQLGDGTTNDSYVAVVAIPAGSSATAVSVGASHTCAVVAGGVKCWGYNTDGQLGNNSMSDSPLPVQAIAAGSGATAVAAGNLHTCAIVSGGARCWGRNTYGQLGSGMTDSLVPVQAIAAGSNVTSIGLRFFSSCAAVAGSVRCWGDGFTGMETIPGVSGASAIGVGESHVCALIAGGVQCWGDNSYGQLGDGGLGSGLPPVQTIPAGSGVTAISAAGYGSCALLGGNAQCWGYNYYGQFGVSPGDNVMSPTSLFLPGNTVSAIATSGGHTCAVVNGRVQCLGYSDRGNLGARPPVADTARPQPAIDSGNGATRVASGYGYNCVLANGGVRCWGLNSFGQLGNGTTQQSTQPVTVIAEGSGLTDIATRYAHVCTLSNSGDARCWGYNSYGQVGVGNSMNQLSPKPVYDLASGGTLIAPGTEHSCAIISGSVRCWGRNDSGQLGEGHYSYIYTPGVPTAVTGTVTALSSGAAHSCAVASGGVQCWGSNISQLLGIFGISGSNVPVQSMPAGSGVTDIVTTANFTCALVNGGVRCWGNYYINGSYFPANLLPAGSSVAAIAGGARHICVLINGGVQCLGNNSNGQLGDGTRTDRSSFVQAIPAGSGVTSLSAGDNHTCAVINGGALCWGGNDYGQLADPSIVGAVKGTRYVAAVPAAVATQIIGFGALPNVPVNTPAFTLSALGGGSGNPVVFSSQTPTICATSGINGATLTLTGTTGNCTIAANQAGNASYANAATVVQTFLVSASIAFTGTVVSRKQHGMYTGNLPIVQNALFNAATIEPRGIGAGHQIVFLFNNSVTSATTTVADAMDVPIPGATASPSFSGNELIVTLTGIADVTRVKVKATQVNGALSVEAPVAFLYGDVNQTGKVTAADIAAIKAKSGATSVDASTYLRDINVNGSINSTDVSAVKAKAGNVLP